MPSRFAAFRRVWPEMMTLLASIVIGLRNPNSWMLSATFATPASFRPGVSLILDEFIYPFVDYLHVLSSLF